MSVESYKTLSESKKANNDYNKNKENDNARGHVRGKNINTTRQRK